MGYAQHGYEEGKLETCDGSKWNARRTKLQLSSCMRHTKQIGLCNMQANPGLEQICFTIMKSCFVQYEKTRVERAKTFEWNGKMQSSV